MKSAIAVLALAFSVTVLAQDAPKAPRVKGSLQAQPVGKGQAAAIAAAHATPAATTVMAGFYALEQSVAYYKAAIPKLKAENANPILIAQSEATLKVLESQLAATPRPANPFNK